MKRYRVELLPEAREDLYSSYEWGIQSWGKAQADEWLRTFYATCKKRLRHSPKACPLAPESHDLNRELRHLIIGRYRVIFVIEGQTVTILHVRGAYVGVDPGEDVDE